MTAFSEWLVRWSQQWLERFRQRHDLTSGAEQATRHVLCPSDGNSSEVLLHVGCGYARIGNIPVSGFHDPSNRWREVRLDADIEVAPDIVGSMTDMAAVADSGAGAIFSSHGIEHLYWHDVPRALAEFLRVLTDDGFVVITCPDVQEAARMIAEDRMFETAYVSPAGPITPFDIVYSYRPFVEENPVWMSHHCGFTLSTLTESLRNAGFSTIRGIRRARDFDLWILASKSQRTDEEMDRLAISYLPQAN